MVSFKNTLVLLTSNIGSRVIAASSGGLAAFGSRRSLMGGGDEADDAISKAEQVGGPVWPYGRLVESRWCCNMIYNLQRLLKSACVLLLIGAAA